MLVAVREVEVAWFVEIEVLRLAVLGILGIGMLFEVFLLEHLGIWLIRGLGDWEGCHV